MFNTHALTYKKEVNIELSTDIQLNRHMSIELNFNIELLTDRHRISDGYIVAGI